MFYYFHTVTSSNLYNRIKLRLVIYNVFGFRLRFNNLAVNIFSFYNIIISSVSFGPHRYLINLLGTNNYAHSTIFNVGGLHKNR